MPKEILPQPVEVNIDTTNISIDSITRDGITTYWPETKGSMDNFLGLDSEGKLGWSTPSGEGNVSTNLIFENTNAMLITDIAHGSKSIKESGIQIDNNNNITNVNSIQSADVDIMSNGTLNLFNLNGYKSSVKCSQNLNSNYTLKLPSNIPSGLQQLKTMASDASQLEFITTYASTLPSSNKTIFVAINGDNLNGNGSFDSPYANLSKAINVANGMSSLLSPITIRIEAGIYTENNTIGPLTITAQGISIAGVHMDSVILKPVNLNQPLINIAIEANISNITLLAGSSINTGIVLSGVNNKSTLNSVQSIGFHIGIELSGSGSLYILRNIVVKNNHIGVNVVNTRAVIQTSTVEGSSTGNASNTGIIMSGSAGHVIFSSSFLTNCMVGISSLNNCISEINGLNAVANTTDVYCASGSVMYLNSIQIAGSNSDDDIAIYATDTGTNIEMESCNLDGYNYTTNQRSGVGVFAKNNALIHVGNSQFKRFITGAIVGESKDTSSTGILITDTFFNNDTKDIEQLGTSSLVVYSSVVALSKITINDPLNVFLNFTDTVSNIMSIGTANVGNSPILQSIQGLSNNPQLNFKSNLYSTKAFTTQNFANDSSTLANISNNNSWLTAITSSNARTSSLRLVSDTTNPTGGTSTIRGWDITKNANTNAQLDFNFQNADETGTSVVPQYNLMRLDGVERKVYLADNSKLQFSTDVNLYKSGANKLKTDSNFIIDLLVPSRVVYADSNKQLTSSYITDEELNFLSGVSSSVQTQLNNKLSVAGGTMSGRITLPLGTPSNPSLNFTGSLTTGISADNGHLSFITDGSDSINIFSNGNVQIPSLGTKGILHNDVLGNLTTSLIMDEDISSNAGISNSKLATLTTSGLVANSATSATNSNTPSAIVARDSSGNFSAGMISISGTPTHNTDIATKAYVDVAIQLGFTVISPAVVLGVDNIANLSGLITIDNVPLNNLQRVLLINQTNPIQNGVYVVSAGPWIRSSDFFNGSVAKTSYVLITSGRYYHGSAWVCNTPDAIIGEDEIAFSEFSLPNSVLGSNVGTGAGQIYKDAMGSVLNFKTLSSDNHISISNNTNEIQIQTDATELNVASKIVSRDATGGFSAGMIHAGLTGNVTGSASLNVLKTGDTMTGNLVVPQMTFTGYPSNILTSNINGLVFSTNNNTALTIGLDGSFNMPYFTANGVLHMNTNGNLTNSLIIDSDISSSAGISNGKLATLTTAGLVSNSATTATNSNTALAIVARDITGNFSAGTITADIIGNLTGNASGNLPIVGGTMTGALTLIAGNTTTPSINFTGSTNAGLSATSGALSLITNNLERLNVSSGGTISINSFTSSGIVHNNAFGNLTSSLIVASDISPSANIANESLATITQIGLVANSATSATDTNTASAIVARDVNGAFSAGTITANLTGNVTGNASGNLLLTGGIMTGALTLPSSILTAPSLTFSNGNTTGITSTSANALSLITNGVERINIDSSGRVNIKNAISLSNLETVGFVYAGLNGNLSSTAINLAQDTTGILSNSNTTATNLNTASAIVARDANGNFSAGSISATNITANLIGSSLVSGLIASASNGLLINALLGSGLSYDTITNTLNYGGVLSITGTANRITASASSGAITLDLPQDIATTSTPTFAGLRLGSLSGLLKATTGTIGVTSSTDYVASLTGTANRITVSGSTGAITLNLPQDINTTSSVLFAGIRNSGLGAGLLTSSSNGTHALSSIGSGIAFNTGTNTLSNSGVLSLTGTANRITASASTGAITLNLPQDIATGSTPQFARLASSSIGTDNILLGSSSGASMTTCLRNIAIGTQTLFSNSTANNNIGIGYQTLYNCVGANNVAIGFTAGFACTSGANNTFIGDNAGRGSTPITTGGSNTYIGASAVPSSSASSGEIVIGNTTGKGNNTAMIRADTGLHVSNLTGGILASTSGGRIQRSVGTDFISNTGTNNVLLGSNTSITTGSFNVHLGVNTQASSITVTNEIVIGSQSTTTTGRGTNTAFINAPSGLFSFSPAFCQLRSTAFNNGIVTWEFLNDGTTLYNNGFQLLLSNTQVAPPYNGLYEVTVSGSAQAQASLFVAIDLNTINVLGFRNIAYQSSSGINTFIVNVSGTQLSRPYVTSTPALSGWQVNCNGGKFHSIDFPLFMTIKFISL
jgi:hypothetical protein